MNVLDRFLCVFVCVVETIANPSKTKDPYGDGSDGVFAVKRK